MTSFVLAAAMLVIVALVLLLRPWWRSVQARAGSLPALNAAIHRDRLAELERDHRNGSLSDEGLAEARQELQRQLLEDTAAAEDAGPRSGIPGTQSAGPRSGIPGTQSAPASLGRRSGIALAILLPLLAVALYGALGTPSAVLPAAAQAQRASADMEQLAAKLAQKLEANPNNPEGWAMLARSYKSLGRWDDAERAYARIGPGFDQNAELVAELAEMLVQKNNGFTQRSRELTRQALRLEPDNMLALFLGGGEAFEGGRYTEAAATWQRLLPKLEPGSEDARMVEASIAEARVRGGGGPRPSIGKADVAPGAVAPSDEVHRGVAKAGTAATTAKAAAKPSAKAVSGRVELAPALKDKAGPNDVVFIFARAVDGPRMPLAAQRARVADLPMDFMLDDSQALMPEAAISSAAQVRIEVRVSKSGNAAPGKGDLTGKSVPVKPGASGLRIVVDSVEP